jgi:hypothetical protein
MQLLEKLCHLCANDLEESISLEDCGGLAEIAKIINVEVAVS